ncbi:FlgD immunoglobulin-like domain containing protein [Fibrobacterota bacterium]
MISAGRHLFFNLSVSTGICCLTAFTYLQALPAFPGAQGFGSHTPGGRGGIIIEVTNLNDSGPGSFREACGQTGPRIIVFKTGGVIELQNEIQINEPFITIAGQTAPGNGIVLKNCQLTVLTHDVIIRGMRFRPGDNPEGAAPEIRDCLSLLGAHNVILDHCSLSWGIDENVSVWQGSRDVSIQWCIISEGLFYSLHAKVGHSMGLLVGNGSALLSIHHNLFAHNNGRNPLISGGTNHEFINNVIFDWGYASEFYEEGIPFKADVYGNYFKPFTNVPGPQEYAISINFDSTSSSRIYCQDNFLNGKLFFTPEQKQDFGGLSLLFPENSAMDSSSCITSQPVLEAYDTVLAAAGALLPARDAVDSRIIQDAKDSAGMMVDCVGPDTIYYPMDTARGGSDTSILLSRRTALEPRGYVGRVIEIVNGTGLGQIRTITAYHPGSLIISGSDTLVDTLQEATVNQPWQTIPDPTSVYRIIIPCGNNAGGWPLYSTGTSYADTDHDGMPDNWETAHGLDYQDPTDGPRTGLSMAGYTNIEVFLNGLIDSAGMNTGTAGRPSPLPDSNLAAWPNPFSSRISIRILPDMMDVPAIKIHDYSGRQVKSLTPWKNPSGHYLATWEGDDERGTPVPGGIYVLRITAGSLVRTRQVMLLR